MPSLELIQEIDRQLTVCNACRYCEGFCAVFPAMESRRNFANEDLILFQAAEAAEQAGYKRALETEC